MSKYKRMTYVDRCRLQALLEEEKSVIDIAKKLRLHKSSVYRELKRTKHLGVYDAFRAQCRYRSCFRRCRRRYKIGLRLRSKIVRKIRSGWSPDEITSRFRREGVERVSHETIYRFLDRDRKQGGNLYKNLRRQRPGRRRRRFPRVPRHSLSAYYQNISERPRAADRRSQIGHWERDTMLGKNRESALLVMVDRKSRYCKIEKLKTKTANEVGDKTAKILIESGHFGSVTSDNGTEMRCSGWRKWAARRMFYCDPYQPNQRGSVENCIGLLRQYFPKKTDLSKINHRQIKMIERRLNLRPRKILDYKTPYEVFFAKPVALAT